MTKVVTTSPKQLAVHKATELASVLLVTPFGIYLATRRELPTWARVFAAGLAASVLVVDGGLLLSWKTRERGRKK